MAGRTFGNPTSIPLELHSRQVIIGDNGPTVGLNEPNCGLSPLKNACASVLVAIIGEVGEFPFLRIAALNAMAIKFPDVWKSWAGGTWKCAKSRAPIKTKRANQIQETGRTLSHIPGWVGQLITTMCVKDLLSTIQKRKRFAAGR